MLTNDAELMRLSLLNRKLTKPENERFSVLWEKKCIREEKEKQD